VIVVAAPNLQRVQRHLKRDRIRALTGEAAHRLLAVPIFLLAATIALPIPFGNVAPAAALIVLSLALLARDGLAVVVALMMGALAFAWTGFLFFAGGAALDAVLERMTNLAR
jgi:hypothetical protein